MMDKDEETPDDPAVINKEGNPSTSKEAHQRHSEPREDDSRSASGYQSFSREASECDYSSVSRTNSSVHNQAVAKADTCPEGPRHMNYGRPRPPAKKKKALNKNLVRVEKRKPVPKRKAATRRDLKRLQPLRRAVRAERANSYCTVFSRNSERSKESKCRYCGKRAFRRSVSEMSTVLSWKQKYEKVVSRRKVKSRKIYKYRRARRKAKRGKDKFTRTQQVGRVSAPSAGTQVSMVLSPLCVSKKTRTQDESEESPPYCEIAPDMIHEALRVLTKWRDAVETEWLLAYISRNYPVNTIQSQLERELVVKLKIALAAGTVVQKTENSWMLPDGMQGRELSNTHVSLFWKLYADTMQPVTKKEKTENPKKLQEESKNTPDWQYADPAYVT